MFSAGKTKSTCYSSCLRMKCCGNSCTLFLGPFGSANSSCTCTLDLPETFFRVMIQVSLSSRLYLHRFRICKNLQETSFLNNGTSQQETRAFVTIIVELLTVIPTWPVLWMSTCLTVHHCLILNVISFMRCEW